MVSGAETERSLYVHQLELKSKRETSERPERSPSLRSAGSNFSPPSSSPSLQDLDVPFPLPPRESCPDPESVLTTAASAPSGSNWLWGSLPHWKQEVQEIGSSSGPSTSGTCTAPGPRGKPRCFHPCLPAAFPSHSSQGPDKEHQGIPEAGRWKREHGPWSQPALCASARSSAGSSGLNVITQSALHTVGQEIPEPTVVIRKAPAFLELKNNNGG
ncbi:uncharacterized protein LOC120238251 [Hyaena hyaena]|uniref:uncharacterized protein LOC120238251 n=1 Tax=Hyaena hyaena TaxID=95912 RepID=UPI001922A3DA|nr:uncharacterized protein LOC120238251 [Hyaena hyaena]